MTGTPTQAGIEFGPTPNGKTYISLYAHRGANPVKSAWAIPPEDEFAMFSAADAGDWFDADGHYWSLQNRGTSVVGAKGEHLARHPRTQNPSDPWHGYPVSPRRNGAVDAPPDALVERWLVEDVVDRTFARRVQRRRL